MAELLRRAAPAELAEIVRLANAVFRPGDKGDMGGEFPTLFSAANAANLYVAFEGRRPVAHVGVQPFAVRMDGVVIPVACVGAVCTAPEFRGRGLAWRLLDMAIADARARGDVFMPISGGRSLYRRHAAVPFGLRHDFVVRRERLGAPLGRPCRPGDAGAACELLNARSVGYVQERPAFEALLGVQLAAGGRAFALEGRAGELAALAVLRPDPGDRTRLWLLNSAGAPEAVAGLCAAALDDAGSGRLWLTLMGHEEPLLRRFLPLGEASVARLTAGHTVKILDLAKLAALLAARLSPLAPRAAGEALALRLPGRGETLLSDPTQVGYLLLSPPELWPAELGLDPAVGRAAQPVLPLPFPEYGLNYI